MTKSILVDRNAHFRFLAAYKLYPKKCFLTCLNSFNSPGATSSFHLCSSPGACDYMAKTAVGHSKRSGASYFMEEAKPRSKQANTFYFL